MTGIPHLMSPVVTDPKQAVFVLKWVVAEMESRYRKMSKMGVRKLSTYNERVREAQANGQKITRKVQTGFDETTGEPVHVEEVTDPETMPYIVIIVDEMADLMMAAGKEIEGLHSKAGADGEGIGDPCRPCHAAPVGRCHNRNHQGEHSDSGILPGCIEDRQPHRAR